MPIPSQDDFLSDTVRNVIESGEVFTHRHLAQLEETLDEIDSDKYEVKKWFELVRCFLDGKVP